MDIVERLRRPQIDEKRTVDALRNEAADEIERLRTTTVPIATANALLEKLADDREKEREQEAEKLRLLQARLARCWIAAGNLKDELDASIYDEPTWPAYNDPFGEMAKRSFPNHNGGLRP